MLNINFTKISQKQYDEFKCILQNDLQEKLFSSGEVKLMEDAISLAKHILREKLPLTLNDENNFIWQMILKDTGEQIGYIWITLTKFLSDEQYSARITYIYIHDTHREKEYAKQVMVDLEKIFKNKYKCNLLTLNVFRSNIHAHKMYLKLGFNEDKNKSTVSRCEMIKFLK